TADRGRAVRPSHLGTVRGHRRGLLPARGRRVVAPADAASLVTRGPWVTFGGLTWAELLGREELVQELAACAGLAGEGVTRLTEGRGVGRDPELVGRRERPGDGLADRRLDDREGRLRLHVRSDGFVQMNAAGVRQEVGDGKNPSLSEDLEGARAVGDVRAGCDDRATELLGDAPRDRVGPGAR